MPKLKGMYVCSVSVAREADLGFGASKEDKNGLAKELWERKLVDAVVAGATPTPHHFERPSRAAGYVA